MFAACIMHIGFIACFHAISLERSRFSKIAAFFFLPLYIGLKLLVSLISRLVACSGRIVGDRQTRTHRTTTVTLAAHARRGSPGAGQISKLKLSVGVVRIIM